MFEAKVHSRWKRAHTVHPAREMDKPIATNSESPAFRFPAKPTGWVIAGAQILNRPDLACDPSVVDGVGRVSSPARMRQGRNQRVRKPAHGFCYP